MRPDCIEFSERAAPEVAATYRTSKSTSLLVPIPVDATGTPTPMPMAVAQGQTCKLASLSMIRFSLSALLVACAFIGCAQTSLSPSAYRRIEYMIPMRDGIKLHTVIYVPTKVAGRHPILLERSPYGTDEIFVDPLYLKAGYIIGEQDVRGAFLSEGKFVDVRPENATPDEATDTWDTIDYLVKHVPSNNGAVGLHGVSYPGFYAAAGAIHTHPALKAISPQAPVSNWFIGDDTHHNGALFLQDMVDFGSWFFYPRKGPEAQHEGLNFDRPSKNPYDFFLSTGALPNFDTLYFHGKLPFWENVMRHDTYDAWWKARSNPEHLVGVTCPVLTVGGWFDAEDMWGALHTSSAIEKQDPGTPNFLVMGPWFHGMWAMGEGRFFGDLDFQSDTSGWFRRNVEFPFFERYLRGKSVPPPARATMFETGANKWRTFAQWPPAGLASERWYLSAGHTVSPAPVAGAQAPDTYVEDPAHPTPYLANPATPERTREYMIDDQRWAEKRPDVLTYKSAALTQDHVVAGPIDVDLTVSTSGTDSDFIVKVIDVWPDNATQLSWNDKSMAGYEQELRADVMRGKFRNSYEHPEPFEPGRRTRLHFKLNDVLHDFRKSHRIMVQIQSAWFPLVDRNPNRFEDINTARDSDFQPATISIYHDQQGESSIGFGQLGS